MGYDKPRSLGDSAQAALYTAPIFRDFMKLALKDTPDTPFRVPPGHQADLGRRPQRHALERPGLDHRGVQARHLAARAYFGDSPTDPNGFSPDVETQPTPAQ